MFCVDGFLGVGGAARKEESGRYSEGGNLGGGLGELGE